MTNKELLALISLLDDTDEEIIQHVENKLLSLGTEIIPTLVEQWEKYFTTLHRERIENVIQRIQKQDRIQKLINWKEEGAEDLVQGMWIIATIKYPDLDYEEISIMIEQLYYDAWMEFSSEVDDVQKVKILNGIFYNKFKFRANAQNFHSPLNSMINDVLKGKKGNPISLCVVYMLIAKKLNLPIFGVNLPNLFVLTYKNEDIQFYINAFNRGLIFTKKDINNYLEQLGIEKKEEYFEPCNNLEIIKRTLRNLMIAFEKNNEEDNYAITQELLSKIS